MTVSKAAHGVQTPEPSTEEAAPAQVNEFLREISALPGGEHLRACIQCGTCSGSCPNANVMTYAPRQMIAMVQAGMEEELLNSNSMWFCESCYLCSARCPRGIPVTDIMYMLKNMAIKKRARAGDKKTAAMVSSFVDTVAGSGRLAEMPLMLRMYMRTTDPIGLVGWSPLGLKLLRRKRMTIGGALKGEKVREIGEFKAIMTKARELGEAA